MLYLFAVILFICIVFLVGILLRRDAVKNYKLEQVDKEKENDIEAKKELKKLDKIHNNIKAKNAKIRNNTGNNNFN